MSPSIGLESILHADPLWLGVVATTRPPEIFRPIPQMDDVLWTEYAILPADWRCGAIRQRLAATRPDARAAIEFCRTPYFVATGICVRADQVNLVGAHNGRMVSVQFSSTQISVRCVPAIDGALVHRFEYHGEVPQGVYDLLKK